MRVTAKVKLANKSELQHGDQVGLSFAADYEDGRNAEWAAATPSLSLSMTVKAEVAEHFERGHAYTLTFEPSDPAPVDEPADPAQTAESTED